MYSSLDRVDIITKTAEGRPRCHLADHRAPAEMEHDRELSVLFALTRILNARRIAQEQPPSAAGRKPLLGLFKSQSPAAPAEPEVVYITPQPPPEFLRRAIRAAGANLVLMGGDAGQAVPQDDAPTVVLGELLQTAFADLARRVSQEYGVEFSQEGLAKLEASLAGVAGTPEEDEVKFWSAVMMLGSFAGELIRAENGGLWQVAETGTLPLALDTTMRGEKTLVNPLGKAIKRFVNGEEDSVAYFLKVVCAES